jgi:hypothetical protein
MSTVRFRNGAPRGLHVSVRPIFTFGSDIGFLGRGWVGAGVFGLWRGLVSWLVVCGAGFRLLVAVAVAGAGLVVGAGVSQGGPAARVLRRRLRVFGGSPLAARWVSSCRAFQARRMRRFRTMSRVAVNSVRGARPVRRHQPRVMSLLAGSLAARPKPRGASADSGGHPVVRARPHRRRASAGRRSPPLHPARPQQPHDGLRGWRTMELSLTITCPRTGRWPRSETNDNRAVARVRATKTARR